MKNELKIMDAKEKVLKIVTGMSQIDALLSSDDWERKSQLNEIVDGIERGIENSNPNIPMEIR